MAYFHLNCQSAYDSPLSVILPEKYAERAEALSYSGIGIADSSLHSFPSFSDACNKKGLKPIFGFRTQLRMSSTLPISICLYIKNEEGYLNLCSFFANGRRKELTIEDLIIHHNGLILVIDSTNEDFQDSFYLDMISRDIYDCHKAFREDLYFGIGIYSASDKENMENLYAFCKDNGYQTIAFPKSVYLRKNDSWQQELLEKAVRKEKAENLSESGPYFLLSLKSIDALYRAEDIQRTEQLADSISFVFFTKRGELTRFSNEDEELKKKATENLSLLFHGNIPIEYQQRLEYELSVIKDMHFSSYFLLVSDYVNYARNAGIKVGPGRGSAGGSLVSYAMKITLIDPLRFHLSFERFLNPKRKNMPDIDVDFEDDRREEVIRYIRNRYGESKVADIMTFSKLKPRSALNLIGPALDFNVNRLKRLTSTIAEQAGSFEEAEKDSYYGKRFRELTSDPYFGELCEKAKPLIGIPINTSIHAAGVIISENDIHLTCPRVNGTSGPVEYEYPNMERLGFLKVDILSLSNLSFIKEIESNIRALGKDIPDVYSDLNNPEVYKVLNNLDMSFIFQLESDGMKEAIRTIKPSTFEDIAALLALYRPGPKEYIPSYGRRKRDQEKITYKSELLRPILEDTFGIIIYQEQVIEAVKALASFSAGDADLFRRAISKKDLSKMEMYKDEFIKGCTNNGIEEKTAIDIYDDIEKFADYGFNKSHAYAYALITYQLLYYKANYMKEFYTAAFHSCSLSSQSASDLIDELKHRGIILSLPDINQSEAFSMAFKENKAYIPLSSISGISKDIANKIIEARKDRPFSSFYDFTFRTYTIFHDDERTLNALIDSGCFDALFDNREALKKVSKDYLGFSRMFFHEEDIIKPTDDEEDLGQRLYHEKNRLGRLVSLDLSELNQQREDGSRILYVSDTSQLEMDHLFQADDTDRSYQFEYSGKDIENYQFIIVKTDGWKFRRIKYADIHIIGKRTAKHGKDIHR